MAPNRTVHLTRFSLLAAAGVMAFATSHPASAAQLSHAAPPHLMKTLGAAVPQAASGQPPLTYQTANARVESGPVIYAVFWGEQWQVGWTDVSNSGATYTSTQAMQYLTGFLDYIGSASTSWFGSQTQYCSGVAVGTVNCGSAGTHVAQPSFGGSWVDTTDAPPPPVVPDNCVEVCVTGNGSVIDEANLVGQEALNAERHFGYSPNADYLILLPKATGSPGYGAYCAYHSEITDSAGNRVSFTNMPYDMDVNTLCGENFVNDSDNSFGNGYMDGYSIVAGHEIAEAATDATPFTASAWRDSSGAETGDKCAWLAPGTDGGSHNIGPDSAGHVYAVQTLWSNTAGDCV